MSIGPILPGRLPNSFATTRLQRQISSGRVELQRLQDQLTTGQKFQSPSENPAAALRTIILQKRIEQNDGFQSAAQTSQSLLSATDNAFTSVTDAIGSAKAFILQGIGDTVSDTERNALATEVGAVLNQVLSSANTTFRGRYLFSGSETGGPPFELVGNGAVRYSGNTGVIDALVDTDTLIPNNLDGHTGFNALATVDSGNLNPALTLETRLSDLYAGAGVDLGSINISLADGATGEGRTIDLSHAKTINDVKTIIEDAFSGGAIQVTVDIDPASQSGIRLTPSSGTATVAVSDLAGSRVAGDLGIASAATSQILGGDIDPKITLRTQLSDLNGGAGIGATAGNGLLISNGTKSAVIDLSSATTVEDLLNELRLADLDLDVDLNDSGNGIRVSSRLSGAQFSIGENNAGNATALGLRTLTGDTQLAELHLGRGLASDAGDEIEITRRDGSAASIDISSATTIQEVLDLVNAVDPGNLVASLNTVGNGISLTDNSGTGPLSVAGNTLSSSLGIAGTESGSDPTVALTGQEINPQESQGIISILSSLQTALRNGDDRELERLNGLLDLEANRSLGIRGEVGTRLQTLDHVENSLLDEEVVLKESLSEEFDADLAEVLSNFLAQEQALQATYQVAGQSFQLSLLSYI
jgi:flagellar hook-associated protein 3 FlgL